MLSAELHLLSWLELSNLFCECCHNLVLRGPSWQRVSLCNYPNYRQECLFIQYKHFFLNPNLGLLRCRQILSCLSHQGSPRLVIICYCNSRKRIHLASSLLLLLLSHFSVLKKIKLFSYSSSGQKCNTSLSRLKSRCLQDCIPSGNFRGESVPNL